jgi:hypothetical protein
MDEMAGLQRWRLDGAIPTGVEARLTTDSRFPAAVRALAGGMLKAAADDRAAGR